MRLIDADALKASIDKQIELVSCFGEDLAEIGEILRKGFMKEVDNAPTIEPEVLAHGEGELVAEPEWKMEGGNHPCDTCKHKNLPWHEEPCDSCCGSHSGYERG